MPSFITSQVPDNSCAKQNRENRSVDQRFGYVFLDLPPVVPDAKDCRGVDCVMQSLPMLPHSTSYCGKGCRRERGQYQQRRESNQYKRTLCQVFDDFAESQIPVEDNPGRKVHQRVEKREQTQHAAKARQPVPASNTPQRCNRQGDHDESQSPVAEAIEDFFDRICAQSAAQADRIGDDEACGKKAQQKNNRLPEKADLLQRIQWSLVIAAQIQALVQVGDVLTIAVKHQRFLLVRK